MISKPKTSQSQMGTLWVINKQASSSDLMWAFPWFTQITLVPRNHIYICCSMMSFGIFQRIKVLPARFSATHWLLFLLWRENGPPCLNLKTWDAMPTHHKELIGSWTNEDTICYSPAALSKRKEFLLSDKCTHQIHVSVWWYWHKRGGTNNDANGNQRPYWVA